MKEESLIKNPGYKYNEYKIVLYPNEDVSDKIQSLKQEISEENNLKETFYSKPALGLVNFIQFDMMEDRLIHRLKTFAKSYRPFNVELNGFGSYPSHTIFINVESKQTIQNLVKELKSLQQLMTLNKQNKPHFLRDPNFILAGKLLPWQYEKGWLYYSQQQFTSRFRAGEMILLKRSLSTSSPGKESNRFFRAVESFEFQNLPVFTSQGDLFM